MSLSKSILCYVVKKTALANDFRRGKFTPISEEEYIDTLIKTIKIVPNEMLIQRVTAGINDDSLISPEWCKDKHKTDVQYQKSIREKWLYLLTTI